MTNWQQRPRAPLFFPSSVWSLRLLPGVSLCTLAGVCQVMNWNQTQASESNICLHYPHSVSALVMPPARSPKLWDGLCGRGEPKLLWHRIQLLLWLLPPQMGEIKHISIIPHGKEMDGCCGLQAIHHFWEWGTRAPVKWHMRLTSENSHLVRHQEAYLEVIMIERGTRGMAFPPSSSTNMSFSLCREGNGGLPEYQRERRIYGGFRKTLQHCELGL